MFRIAVFTDSLQGEFRARLGSSQIATKIHPAPPCLEIGVFRPQPPLKQLPWISPDR